MGWLSSCANLARARHWRCRRTATIFGSGVRRGSPAHEFAALAAAPHPHLALPTMSYSLAHREGEALRHGTLQFPHPVERRDLVRPGPHPRHAAFGDGRTPREVQAPG